MTESTPVRRLVRRLACGFAAVGAAALVTDVVERPAHAQDAADVASPAEDEPSISDLLNRLRMPVTRKVPGRLRETVDRLLASGSPLARTRFGAMLQDPSAPRDVVEQIALSVISDPGATELLGSFVERLRLEGDSSLGRRIRAPVAQNANETVVRALSELCLNSNRPVAYRVTAVETLGECGQGGGLATLVQIWGTSGDEALRAAAQRAFRRILPATPDIETARSDVAELGSGVTLAQLLRRRIAGQVAAPTGTGDRDAFEQEYIRLAHAAVAALPLEQLLDLLVVASPSPGIRVAAVARVSGHDFAADPDATPTKSAAAAALLAALDAETHDDVEQALLAALIPFADSLRESVTDAGLETLTVRAQVAGRASRRVRESALRMIRALRDPRPAKFLQDQYDLLADTDAELRRLQLGALEKLENLDSVDVRIVPWLTERLQRERDVEVAEQLVIMLTNSPEDVSHDVFIELLRVRTAEGEAGLRNSAASALGKLWGRGVPAARAALVELGLRDASPRVRSSSAGYLKGGPKEGLDETLPALKRVLLEDEDTGVREEAARAVLELAPDDALGHLGDAIDVDAVFEVYVANRLLELERELPIKSVLDDAQSLWDSPVAARRARGVALLASVVASRDRPWEAEGGRGMPREQLAEWLLVGGDPSGAMGLAGELVTSARDDDPKARWSLLEARAAHAIGDAENLRGAARILLGLEEAAATTPHELHVRVFLELGDVLLRLGDPRRALVALTQADEAASALGDDDRARAGRLLTAARAGTNKERAKFERIMEALSRPATEASAKTDLDAMGDKAAWRVGHGIENAKDDDERRLFLKAAGELADRTFEPDADKGDGAVQAICEVAKRKMDELVLEARNAYKRAN